MYCKNCGAPIDPNAEVCIKCGHKNWNGNNYCPHCGAEVNPEAVVCVHCGCSLSKAPAAGEGKSKIAAGLLGIFLGSLGIHNFYLGYTGKAVAQLLITLLSCGIGATVTSIWGLVEGILILTGSIKTDAKGMPLTD